MATMERDEAEGPADAHVSRSAQRVRASTLTTDKERWGVWPVDARYLASSLGRVIGPSGKIIKPYMGTSGYLQVPRRENGVTKSPKLHRMIAETLLPNPHKWNIVRHLDDNPLNNHLANLAWGSQADNMADMRANRGPLVTNKAPGSRQCPTCGRRLAPSQFARDPNGRGGRRTQCRDCRASKRRRDGT